MPTAPRKPCSSWPCPDFAEPNSSKCARHRKEATRQWEARRNRGTAAQRGYDARWRAIRAQVIADRPQCQSPGCPRPSSEAHHVIARVDGGPDTPENLLALCKSHHSKATNREKWKRKGREMMRPGFVPAPAGSSPSRSRAPALLVPLIKGSAPALMYRNQHQGGRVVRISGPIRIRPTDLSQTHRRAFQLYFCQ